MPHNHIRTVIRDNWCVSTITGTGIKGTQLSVFKVISYNPYKIRRGDHDGRIFPSIDAANAFCLERGYTKTYTRADREALLAKIRKAA